jgi:hypothetical protein
VQIHFIFHFYCFYSKLYSCAFSSFPFNLLLLLLYHFLFTHIIVSHRPSFFLSHTFLNVLNLTLLFSLPYSSLPNLSSTSFVFVSSYTLFVSCLFLSVLFPLYFSFPTILSNSSTLLPSSYYSSSSMLWHTWLSVQVLKHFVRDLSNNPQLVRHLSKLPLYLATLGV